MDREAFRTFSRERTACGQHELAASTRALVTAQAPQIAAALRGLEDAPYLEPSLFTYLAIPDLPLGLPQLLLGYVPHEHRPDLVEITTDDAGRAYLPRIGYFSTDQRRASMLLEWDRTSARFALRSGERQIPFQFEAPYYIPGTNIELAIHRDATLSPHFFDTSRRAVGESVIVEHMAALHVRPLAEAFAILREHCPSYHAEIARTTRRVVLFQHSEVRSFASLGAHGTVFLSVRPEDGVASFIDDLAHQCGHVAFSAMTLHRKDFLLTGPNSRLRADAVDDPRSVYGAFHGLYTEQMMIEALDAAERAGKFDAAIRHELLGRLSFISRKAAMDLDTFQQTDVLSELGRCLYGVFRSALEELLTRRPELWTTDMQGQTYAFDAQLFARRNPIESADPGRSTLEAALG